MSPDELPELFRLGWELPKPEPFLAYFLPLIGPDAEFSQPMLPTARGREEIAAMFRRLFVQTPDMTASPRRHAVSGRSVFIESDCTAQVGGRIIHFSVCDRFLLSDGLISERRSFMDPLPLLVATLRSPKDWPAAVRGAVRGATRPHE